MENEAIVQEIEKTEIPLLELSAGPIYPISLHGRTIYVHMKNYLPHDLQELQQARALRMVTMDEFTDMRDVGKIEVVQFFWKHFEKLSGPAIQRKDGSCGTPEEHKKWILAHPRLDIERTVVLQGYGGLDLEVPTQDAGVSLLDISDENPITFTKSLYSSVHGRVVRYQITHIFKQESEHDTRRYKEAVGNVRMYRREREHQILINYSTIEQLYNSLIKEVRGVVFEGKACVRHDIDPWVAAIPFWHKDSSLAELFRGAGIKNG